jgi:hypothetical protein
VYRGAQITPYAAWLSGMPTAIADKAQFVWQFHFLRGLDHILRTGEPIKIDRGGKKLLIVPKEMQVRLSNLVRRDVIVGDLEGLVHLDWSEE